MPDVDMGKSGQLSEITNRHSGADLSAQERIAKMEAYRAAQIAAGNIQSKAQFGTTEPEKPSMGDPNKPSTWTVDGGTGGSGRESRSEATANQQMAASVQKNKFKL